MVEDNFLNIKVSDKTRQLKVLDITKSQVKLKDDKTSEKIVFSCLEEESGRQFEISDTYTYDNKGSRRISGLWLSQATGAISSNSALAQLLKFYGVESLKDLIGKHVTAYPDHKNFLVLTACDIK